MAGEPSWVGWGTLAAGWLMASCVCPSAKRLEVLSLGCREGEALMVLVRAQRDDSAGVWVATSDEVPGLVTEAETLEALQLKLQCLVPELLEANDCLPVCGQVVIDLVTD